MKKKELGDFQTPLPLCRIIVDWLAVLNIPWQTIIEPTCGKGNFIQAILESTFNPEQLIGIELQDHYIEQAKQLATPQLTPQILQQDVFTVDFSQWKSEKPILVIGNPPWVTNAELGALSSNNLPNKSNLKRLNGLDALTGKSNFDLAESIWLKLLKTFKSTPITIALLCKTSVARKVLETVFQEHFRVSQAVLVPIDAKKWFEVTVEASLLLISLNQGVLTQEVQQYQSFDWNNPSIPLQFLNGSLVQDDTFAELYADYPELIWRQGVKHDAATVMELIAKEGQWFNKLDEIVDIEIDYIYPLIKSSDIKSTTTQITERGLILPQSIIGEDTTQLVQKAPKLWAYLQQHKEVFERRKSSIYQGKPPFSIFGVGDYTFAPYKIMVSGFYVPPQFIVISPQDKPVVCDDTCYLLPLADKQQAIAICELLNHRLSQDFFRSYGFKGAKRPITKTLLEKLSLRKLINLLPQDELSISPENLEQLVFPEPYQPLLF